MSDEENTKRWNQYFIPGTNVLKNKLGITNKEELTKKETEITFEKLVELYQHPIDMDFGVEHLRAIHYYLFSDIYPFAGQNRTVYMGKNNSYFSPVEEIDYRLDYTFKLMREELKSVNSKFDFAAFLATYYVELLNIHPFREGNGRTIREFIREYANAKSKELPIDEVNFSWANVDKDAINEVIDKGRAFKSIIELEFMKALEPVSLDKSL